MKRPAVFLDRDGVIIENRAAYVRSWEDVAWLPGALLALQRLAATEFAIVIITNQSAVGRGLLSLPAAEEINSRIVQVIQASGGRVDAVFMCPHAPEANCTCRKPLPGLLFQAETALDLDLSRSILIGDALSDLQAGRSAGLPHTILLLTGRGAAQLALPQAQGMQPINVAASLEQAVAELVDRW